MKNGAVFQKPGVGDQETGKNRKIEIRGQGSDVRRQRSSQRSKVKRQRPKTRKECLGVKCRTPKDGWQKGHSMSNRSRRTPSPFDFAQI